jgi:hypothetical protein
MLTAIRTDDAGRKSPLAGSTSITRIVTNQRWAAAS